MKRTKIAFDELERRILVELLYEKHNELLRAGESTDAIDELIMKIVGGWGTHDEIDKTEIGIMCYEILCCC